MELCTIVDGYFMLFHIEFGIVGNVVSLMGFESESGSFSVFLLGGSSMIIQLRCQ